MNLDPVIQLVEPYLPLGLKHRFFDTTNQLIAKLDEGRGLLDARRLVERLPQLNMYDMEARAAYRALENAYSEYTSTISTPKMAISLELAIFLLAFCNLTRPRSVLDLGSGFSSFVLRLYQERSPHQVTVCSVDDSQVWLSKTTTFLTNHGMPTESLIMWERFCAENRERFDLVLHDLGTFKMRIRTLGAALTRIAPGGFAILDDMHKLSYRRFVEKALRERNLTHFSLQAFTKDSIGRFSELVLNGKPCPPRGQ